MSERFGRIIKLLEHEFEGQYATDSQLEDIVDLVFKEKENAEDAFVEIIRLIEKRSLGYDVGQHLIEEGCIDMEEEIGKLGLIAPTNYMEEQKLAILNRLNESLTWDELMRIEKKLEHRLK